ncbi:hypothetical protein A5662_12600 [Mycobacteriaceae bacterium 1482268.1]|nr:hypothetical protein A5662_12600 [Mycobacteriaceae bacterium 1482268.1]
MDASEQRTFKEEHRLEGQRGFIALWELHNAFVGEDRADGPTLHKVQNDTVQLMRELVDDDLTGFTQLSPEAAMAKNKDSYIDNFDDRERWSNIVWMKHAETGHEMVLDLRQSIPHRP